MCTAFVQDEEIRDMERIWRGTDVQSPCSRGQGLSFVLCVNTAYIRREPYRSGPRFLCFARCSNSYFIPKADFLQRGKGVRVLWRGRPRTHNHADEHDILVDGTSELEFEQDVRINFVTSAVRKGELNSFENSKGGSRHLRDDENIAAILAVGDEADSENVDALNDARSTRRSKKQIRANRKTVDIGEREELKTQSDITDLDVDTMDEEGEEDEDEGEAGFDEEDEEDQDDEDDDDLDKYDIAMDDEEPSTGRPRRVSPFDDDENQLSSLSRAPGGRAAVSGDMTLGGVDIDQDDDVVDFEDSGEVIDLADDNDGVNEIDEVDDISAELELDDVEDIDLDAPVEDLAEEALFDEENEADLRLAAETLSGKYLLGLGDDDNVKTDSTELVDLALQDDDEELQVIDIDEDFDDDDVGLLSRKTQLQGPDDESKTNAVSKPRRGRKPKSSSSSAFSDIPDIMKQAETVPVEDDVFADAADDDTLAGPSNLNAYVDMDELDEDDIPQGVTTKNAFGRVWELNEDSYITITEPGQRFAYELDENEAEDQDTLALSRGREGGWGGGLQGDSQHELPEGSNEWIARRAYDLVKKCSYRDMFLWTKRGRLPPHAIAELFPEPPKPLPKLPRTTLYPRMPESREAIADLPDGLSDGNAMPDMDAAPGAETALNGLVSSDEATPSSKGRKLSRKEEKETDSGIEAIERSTNFPCNYRFKVVGGGDSFVESLSESVMSVTGKKIPKSAFEIEPAGKYERVSISITVENATQVTELYEVLRRNSMVKFSYG